MAMTTNAAATATKMASDRAMRLEHQLCFMLYATSRAITNTYRPALDSLGITYPQYLVMLVLWEADNLSVGEIGDKLFLDSGTLTPLLKRLETQNLVVRKRDAADERQVRITLTKAGRDLRASAGAVPEALRCKLPFPISKARAIREDIRVLLAALQDDEAQPE